MVSVVNMREDIGLYVLLFFPFFCAVFIYAMNRIFALRQHTNIPVVQATRTVEPTHTVETIHSVEPLQVAQPFQGAIDTTEPIQVAELLPTSSDI